MSSSSQVQGLAAGKELTHKHTITARASAIAKTAIHVQISSNGASKGSVAVALVDRGASTFGISSMFLALSLFLVFPHSTHRC